MVLRLVRTALVLAACSLAAPTLAQEEELAAGPELCTVDTARAVTLEEVARDFRVMESECITVRGVHYSERYLTDNRIWTSYEAALGLVPDGPSLIVNDRYINYLSIDHRTRLKDDAWFPHWEAVTGWFGSCVLQYEKLEQDLSQNPDIFPLLFGLCHYTDDAHFIVPTDYSPIGGPPFYRTRLGDVPPEQRRIEVFELPREAAAEDTWRLGMEAALESLERDDFERYFAQTAPELFAALSRGAAFLELDPEDFERAAVIRPGFEHLKPAWDDFRQTRDPRLFVLRETDEEQHWGDAPITQDRLVQDGEAIFCMLRDGATPDDFPFIMNEIDNHPSRPFFCVQVYETGRSVFEVFIPFAEEGLLEPPR